jgi:hypothetical protein
VADQFMHLCGDHVATLKPFFPVPWLSAGTLMAAVMGMLIVGAACTLLLRPPQENRAARTGLFFLLGWMLVPGFLLYIYSVAWYPSFNFRYVLYSSLPVFILAGAAVSMVKNRWCQAVVAVLLLALYSINLGHYPHPWRMDWKSVARDLQQDAGINDPILVYGGSHRAPLLYASGFQPDRVGMIMNQRGLVAKCAELAAQGETVWLVVRTDAPDTVGWPSYEELFNRHSLEFTVKTFGEIQPVLKLFRVCSRESAGQGRRPSRSHLGAPVPEERTLGRNGQ